MIELEWRYHGVGNFQFAQRQILLQNLRQRLNNPVDFSGANGDHRLV